MFCLSLEHYHHRIGHNIECYIDKLNRLLLSIIKSLLQLGLN